MRQTPVFVKKIALFSLIIGLLLFCRGLKITVLANDLDVVRSHHDTTQVDEQMSCCGTSESGETLMEHTTEAVLPSSIGLLSIVVVFTFVFFLAWRTLKVRVDRFEYYYHHVRDRYGSFQLFTPLIRLFRIGLLHPKIY